MLCEIENDLKSSALCKCKELRVSVTCLKSVMSSMFSLYLIYAICFNLSLLVIEFNVQFVTQFNVQLVQSDVLFSRPFKHKRNSLKH